MQVDVTAQAEEVEEVERTVTHDPVRDVGVANRDVLRLGHLARRRHGSPR